VSWKETLLWLFAFAAYVTVLAALEPGASEFEIMLLILIPICVIAWRIWKDRP